jgi:excisionase family DNA binding protein
MSNPGEEAVVSLLTVAQAAERASVSESLVYEWIAAGVLPHLRLGKPGKRGVIRIEPIDLDGFLMACRVVGTPTDDGLRLKHLR